MAIEHLTPHHPEQEAAPRAFNEIRTIVLPREDFECLASAFHALRFVIKHCDSTCAENVARIFEHQANALLDEIDCAADQSERGE